MIDFAKLNNPAVHERFLAKQKAAEAVRNAHETRVKNALTPLLERDIFEVLNAKERSFLRSCNMRMAHCLGLSEAQEKWLFDLASRHGYVEQMPSDEPASDAPRG